MPRLKIHYVESVVKELKKQYKFSSVMAVPRIVKVILNMGVGEATQDKSLLDPAVDELTLIAGQKAVKTYAKVAISNFHLRKGMPIGARVTLRGNRMYDFLDKLISIALPRVRDFKGLNPSSFDGRGNYTFGLKEQLVFPEIDYDKIKKIRGLDITIVTTARNDEEAYQLLKMMGFPFREK
ncbi:MAG: 50S ribosomal protein L5 [Brevinematales bacterium]|nr:50S ribosomal protein L5 [Brevinematales bacterium]